MIIVGLNDSNSAAAVMVDGKLVAAAREERFDRIKFSDGFPHRALRYCLKEAGAGIKDVDKFVFAWNPGHELEPLWGTAAVREHRHFLHYIPNNLLAQIGGDKRNKRVRAIEQSLALDQGQVDILFAPHHDCHAASAFFLSPFDDAAVMTIDAYGDDVTHSFYRGRGNRLERLGRTLFPHSMGQVYAALTQYLGYRANSDEWKVMGLSAYGKPTHYEAFKDIIHFDATRGELRFDLDYFTYYIWSPRRYSDRFIEVFGPERYPDDDISQRHMDIAASFQLRVEDVVLEMAAYLHERTGASTLCLAGGVCMNSKMNGRLLEQSPFERVFVTPSADDAGGSIGACLHYWHQVSGNPRELLLHHDYWGPGYSEEQIKAALDDALVPYERLERPEAEAAKAIASGKVIAWFQGRMEFGQRALGNRSILADPRDPEMKNTINRLIKHREWYRPFAPAVQQEHQGEYFTLDGPSEYMQMVYPVHPDKQAVIPSVTHADGTGRVQTVRREANPLYWGLIDEFRKLTGVGVILNTSFNDNDEPIVCTPKEALRTFFGTGLHQLFIGPFRIVKPGYE